VTRLTRLVDDLLSLSLIASKELHLELETTDLCVVVREVVERVRPLARSSGSLVVVRAGAPVTGMWDRTRLDQVVTHLLDNAVKYGAGKPVDVIVEGEGDEARLTVQDQGIGIAPESQARIFQRFERAVSERHYGGFGLGLWIVGQIVDAHDGRIQVESRPGAGTTFIIALPRTNGAAVSGDGDPTSSWRPRVGD
jgi:signal transduction histidine kinase